MSSSNNNLQKPSSFRDSVNTMDAEGSRQWIYPKKPKGKFTNYRTYVSWFLLALLFILPFVKINNNPFLLFNIINREFSIFGKLFFPTDSYLFAVSGITTLIFIILFTVIYGRIFCGWVCPQTIFLEMLFRKIEYAIEGDAGKQKRLDRMPWNEEKIRKKGLKWFIFALLSLMISHTFLSYILSVEVVYQYLLDGPTKHMGLFIGILIFAGLFFFVFTWFREQACTLVCPYGRLQGVLINNDTINVAYDYNRGEGKNGRAKFRKNEDRAALGKGDCIDCHQCVAVCPTGIDIRNGIQLECVNCTACIDACDDMMTKVGLPKGLIRYASENNLSKNEKWKFTPRVIAYTVVLFLLTTITFILMMNRSEIELKVLQYPGQLFKYDKNYIVNNYQLMLINKTNETRKLKVKLLSHQGIIEIFGPETILIYKGQSLDSRLKVKIDKKFIKKGQEKIIIGIFDSENGSKIDEYETGFIGPLKF